jgi:hypothetical protein
MLINANEIRVKINGAEVSGEVKSTYRVTPDNNYLIIDCLYTNECEIDSFINHLKDGAIVDVDYNIKEFTHKNGCIESIDIVASEGDVVRHIITIKLH